MKMKYRIELSKKGLPTMWESGGGLTNTGKAFIVSDSKGQPKKPVFIKSSGSLSCAEHALFIIDKNDIVVECKRNRDDFDILLMYISDVNIAQRTAECTVLSHWSNGEWSDDSIIEEYEDVISAAEEKSRCYHCREAFYIGKGE